MQPRSNKRQKELARAERRKEKELKREERKKAKLARPPWKEGDPDPSIEILPPLEAIPDVAPAVRPADEPPVA